MEDIISHGAVIMAYQKISLVHINAVDQLLRKKMLIKASDTLMNQSLLTVMDLFLNGEINGISSVMKLVDPIIPTFVILQSHI